LPPVPPYPLCVGSWASATDAMSRYTSTELAKAARRLTSSSLFLVLPLERKGARASALERGLLLAAEYFPSH
jgi:hypothetical protein